MPLSRMENTTFAMPNIIDSHDMGLRTVLQTRRPKENAYSTPINVGKTGSVENKPRPGGQSKLTSRAKRMIVRSATNKPMTSAQNIAKELLSLSLSSCNVSVSAQIVRNALHSADLKARTPRKKPYISEVNREKKSRVCHEVQKTSLWIFGKRLFILMRANL
ncbi:hypothetical protein TNCV_2242141 [Trichonephila clavipes]|nr:hypothetical protein TNCV_2242141 [Trichonephila clavipes]